MPVKLAKVTDNVEQTGVIRKGWLSDIWTVPENAPDAHLDDVEILVDCE